MIKTLPLVPSEKIILGIDPGTNIMGYALLVVKGSKMQVLKHDVINLKNITNHAVKLKKIFDRTQELITEYLPDEMAIEAPFYGTNVQSMLKLGRAQGVAIAAALSRDIPYVEYAPKKVKQSITGNGNASKEQVAQMLLQIFKIAEMPKLFDATDALAVALCHHYQRGNNSQAGAKSWKSFLTDNPNRISTK
ncbi:crossover junction endodeoxyribonuclease RuvC [Adhaeribacter terreus]|uniref:Crossover junction endodeoxyribonuclease RuvC n=1 Tax=Adhaeribacter terreus TaxID=529703 RepID=A0ABW0E6H2_9BACT